MAKDFLYPLRCLHGQMYERKKEKEKLGAEDPAAAETEQPSAAPSEEEIEALRENGIEQYQEMLFENAPSRARRIVRKGDVIVSTVRTYLKAVASIQDDDDVIVSTGFAVIRSNKVDPRFMAYSLINHYFVEKVSSLSTGVSYPAINPSTLINIKNIVPPIETQKHLASYLNRI